MKIGDYIVLGVILLWLVLAFCWMHRQKKRGNCIGCSGCAGKNCKNLLYISCGQGVGSGLILNGKLYEGSHLASGE